MSTTDRILARIDAELSPAVAPSLDTDYGFGRLTERVVERGLCWKCTTRPAVDELHGAGLCARCRDALLNEQYRLDWTPPDEEPFGLVFGRRLGPHRCAVDGCRCGGTQRRAVEAFESVRFTLHASRSTKKPPGYWSRLLRALRGRP